MTSTLMVRGAQVFVESIGTGQPMLFLHGSPDSHAMWAPLVERMKDTYHCIMPDLPGFGASTLPDSFALTLDQMADFVGDLLTALKVDRPVTLVVADFGAHYGLAFAVKYPNRVQGVAITNTNFFRDYQWHQFAKLYRMPLVGEVMMAMTTKSNVDKMIKKSSPAMPPSYLDSAWSTGFGSPAVKKTILRMYRSRDSRDFIGWDDKLVALLAVKPSIVLWGDRDPFIAPEFAKRFHAQSTRHFAEYGHWLPLEAPDQYAAALNEWQTHIS